MVRKFKSGATRSSSEGKIEYAGFRHPLCELSFGKYMNKHRVQEDGKLRESNNWWNGWTTDVSLQSMVRHVEDLQAIHAGYNVYKIKSKDGEETVYTTSEYKGNGVADITEEECLNAIRFNTQSYLLEHLKTN